MKYEAPQMEIVAVGVATAIASDVDVEVDLSGMLSEHSQPA